jgi:SAM-dependent methyltransferase
MVSAVGLLGRWQGDLAAWAIPAHVAAAVPDSPWVLPRQAFGRRADLARSDPSGPSYERAWEALGPKGDVLDVGAGAGAACLPLAPRTTALTAVDSDAEMLGMLSLRAAALGLTPRAIHGSWPDVAAQAATADVVTCHHVLYNVPRLEPFVAALTTLARRRVVVEMTDRHPLVALNPLWLRFHGLRRPESPTAADLIAILTALGLRPEHAVWSRSLVSGYASFGELVDVTRRRLCLPPERSGEVAIALRDLGSSPDHPVDPGSPGRELVTVWWEGSA